VKRLTSYLAEEKNVHMEHLEDNLLNGGVDGARQSINYLRSLRDMLAGDAKAPVNVTVKWDGAPAVFAGKDPSDGKFFVAKKGIFNKTAKIYKTDADIDADIASGDLNKKMKLALKHLPKLGIEGVVQGDFLYSKEDLQKTTIDGESYITFHPNTIVYAIPGKRSLVSRCYVQRCVW
jgi:adenine-specific DNA methylase